MANDDKISGEKLQYDINRETNKISALSAVTIDKYESYRWRRITSWSKRVIEQTDFTYSSLGKPLEK